MTHDVVILRRAQKELAALPVAAYGRQRAAIPGLGVSPRPPCVILPSMPEGVEHALPANSVGMAADSPATRRCVRRTF